MNWIIILEILYFLFLLFVCYRIIEDTRDSAKSLAYLLFVIFVPVIGIIIYFSFGINYRKRKIYNKKVFKNAELEKELAEEVMEFSESIMRENKLGKHRKLVNLLLKEDISPLTNGNEVSLLINGEEKFPELLKALRGAKHHIHLEYYIFYNDDIGREVAGVLLQKAKEGVEVRFIYDDFGSRSIRKDLVPRLREGGVKTFPFYEIKLIAFANRLNYRNHRKIAIIDGTVAFVGGINVRNRYINNGKTNLYWRDTHLKIHGPAVWYLQYLFLGDWNFCASDSVRPDDRLFRPVDAFKANQNKLVQIAGSGPDSKTPSILYALFQAINLAEEEILITTPYFIPNQSVKDALIVAAMSGVSVKFLVPHESDSKFVNAASRSYYSALMEAGVEIYQYTKGFVHAKTVVVDSHIAIVGTANMDIRSFELNFEVNAIVYDEALAGKLRYTFYKDIEDARLLDLELWEQRSTHKKILENLARLMSPML
ncbi:cardiolipin synthase [Mangrovimonas aestuarii]|uniref:cardiolipin synthase n=1 Tax=Mangrovimonas aestuarii TaxID=3018443 RepID=UPI0023798FB3|nr:cardiolipin synthase [Mangrovimonas aestuarii]